MGFSKKASHSLPQTTSYMLGWVIKLITITHALNFWSHKNAISSTSFNISAMTFSLAT
eukprot:m.25513 g.25513  ORF g.25513 m.25513 type:complete len:58 (-) comp5772_c0_seq1:1774-1947(-)